MRVATLAEAEAALHARLAQAMLPLSNLERYGTRDHPRSMRFRIDGAAFLGLSAEGVAFPVFPEDHDAAPARKLLAGTELRGVIGPTGSVRSLLAALALNDIPVRKPPAGAGELVALGVHRDLAIAWRSAFEAALGLPSGASVRDQVDRWIAEDTHRLWCVGGAPVALTGVNASLPQIVQVGAVYVPPDLRGRGFARQAVAAHLAAFRETWVRQATLCAASLAAVRAYAALGFRRIGTCSIALFPRCQEVAG